MAYQSSKNFKLFAIFFKSLKFFGTFKLIEDSNLMVELLTRLHSICLMMLYSWLLFSNEMNKIYELNDFLTNYARGVDRCGMILITVGVYLDAGFRRKFDHKIIIHLDQIDELLLRIFRVNFNHRRMMIANFCFLLFFSTPLILTFRHFFMLKLQLFTTTLFAMYTFGIFVVGFVKTVHFVASIQLLIRFKIMDKLLYEKSDEFILMYAVVFLKLFEKLLKLATDFNESFGLFALMMIGMVQFRQSRTFDKCFIYFS